MDADEEIVEGLIDVELLVAVVLGEINADRADNVVQHNSELTGARYFVELINTENVNRFHNVARMDRATFFLLHKLLKDVGGLRDSMYICSGQKIMILIQVLRGETSRTICERWQHSSATISEIVHEVSAALIYSRGHIYRPFKIGDPIPAQIANFSKFSPFFDDCIGALDGSHIPAVLLVDQRGPFRNRKKFISQNVLGVANFDLTYAFGLFGWEGSAHDSRVLDDAKIKGLPMFEGKYYLGDAGYGLSKLVLTPYRGVRYHLREFEVNGQGPANAKELFNLRHSSLRNVVERIFGVSKRRFPILVKMSPYGFEFQCDIVQCCFLLHNFVHINQLYDDQFYNEDGNLADVAIDDHDEYPADNVQYNALKAWRDGIAEAMWTHYQLQF